ncbi:glycosyltransferase family 9 protein [Paludibacterium denitrificans]|uniref:glycosyltransferase family 9 protein n=1 Tax=Paludibacterium denitrificans TaxID=2675226 RepID=UPI001E31E15F|nr:glycosyltransferase family 9 protein [Paludibacterium denitrificans]
MQDFADTAGLIAQLDVVITVDSSVAHLAAALGKPTGFCYRPIPISAGGWNLSKRRGIRRCGCSVSQRPVTGVLYCKPSRRVPKIILGWQRRVEGGWALITTWHVRLINGGWREA